MSYLDVLQHLKEYVIDRKPLSDFSTVWGTNGSTVTVSLSTNNNTGYSNSIKVNTLGVGESIYTELEKALRLDDRSTIRLHITPNATIAKDDLALILSDTVNLSTAVETINLPELAANTINVVNLTITDPKSLSNIQSAGLKSLTDVSSVEFYVSLCDARATQFIATLEDMEDKIEEGETYVLSKLGPDYSSIPDDPKLDEAIHIAAAGYAWLKQKENEQYQYDYGLHGKTRNYGSKLLNRAKIIVEIYREGRDTEDGDTSGEAKSSINTDLLGGSNTDGTFTDGDYVYNLTPLDTGRRRR